MLSCLLFCSSLWSGLHFLLAYLNCIPSFKSFFCLCLHDQGVDWTCLKEHQTELYVISSVNGNFWNFLLYDLYLLDGLVKCECCYPVPFGQLHETLKELLLSALLTVFHLSIVLLDSGLWIPSSGTLIPAWLGIIAVLIYCYSILVS